MSQNDGDCVIGSSQITEWGKRGGERSQFRVEIVRIDIVSISVTLSKTVIGRELGKSGFK
jgi:hypothetical protein